MIIIVDNGFKRFHKALPYERCFHDEQLHAAKLAAIRLPTGLFQIVKNRYGPAASRPVRRKTLECHIARVLEESQRA